MHHITGFLNVLRSNIIMKVIHEVTVFIYEETGFVFLNVTSFMKKPVLVFEFDAIYEETGFGFLNNLASFMEKPVLVF